jgi:hypothetical protein
MNQQPVYVQVIAMDNSAWIWISSAASPLFASQQQQQQQSLQPQIQQGSGGGAGSTQAGSFGDFAMAMPSSRPGQVLSWKRERRKVEGSWTIIPLPSPEECRPRTWTFLFSMDA